MDRNRFLKTLLGATTLTTMDGFSTCANALSHSENNTKNLSEFASFGAIHLNNTNLQKAAYFWTNIVGLKLRVSEQNRSEFGTETKTLVVIHETAKSPYIKGYSGLYHFAIHAPSLPEFARMIHRLNVNQYPYSPIDHTMSKSIYLDDPDGINIEFTLETPERFKRVVTTGGLQIEGTDGIVRSASERLHVNDVLTALEDRNVNNIISEDSYIGHLHLYANHIPQSNTFYKDIGFLEFNFLPQFMYADVGAGGAYKHRVAMNSWHGQNKPLAPQENAGLRHFQINYNDNTKLSQALHKVSDYTETTEGYWLYDPTGNKVLLKNNT